MDRDSNANGSKQDDNLQVSGTCVQCCRVCYSRRHVDYGLMNDDQQTKVSDGALESLISDIRRDLPYSGVSIVHRSLRSRGVTVTRERVQNSLRSIDPLGSALRSPAGLTHRRPYSVPSPNSLWHIG